MLPIALRLGAQKGVRASPERRHPAVPCPTSRPKSLPNPRMITQSPTTTPRPNLTYG